MPNFTTQSSPQWSQAATYLSPVQSKPRADCLKGLFCCWGGGSSAWILALRSVQSLATSSNTSCRPCFSMACDQKTSRSQHQHALSQHMHEEKGTSAGSIVNHVMRSVSAKNLKIDSKHHITWRLEPLKKHFRHDVMWRWPARFSDGSFHWMTHAGYPVQCQSRLLPSGHGRTRVRRVSWWALSCTPPSKNITGSCFCLWINFVGITGKSVTWLPEIISGELISMGLPESLAGSQHSVTRCELVTNWKYW